MYGDRGGFKPRSFAPVKIGDELDVNIEAVGEKGDGIAKKDGFVLFVPNTKEGDTVKVRITKVLRRVGFAEVVGEGQEQPEEAAPAKEAESVPEEEPKEEAPSEGQAEDTEDFGEEEEKKG